MILDTNALSAFAEEDPDLFAILRPSREVMLPVIVLGEYRAGITRSRHRSRYENWLEGLLADCGVLDINQETSRHYAAVVLELRHIGKPIPANDLWIAALCRQHNLSLLSKDRHFDTVSGIHRLDW